MTTADTTNITALLEELTEALSYLPGKHPQDSQIGANLLSYVVAEIHCGQPIRCLMNTMERRGVDPNEAREVARAMHGLALRMGAWLGRDDIGRP